MSNSLKLVSAPVRESRLWDIPGYVPWFTADSATAIGVALRYLAVSLIGYKLTGSTTAAGWLGSLAAIAQQAAAVFGGTFADRHDRKTLIIVNATAGVICWGSVAALLMAGKLVFPVLLAIAVFESAVNGFLGPASDAMLKSIVDIRSYPKARSLNEGRDATINMAGSPVGGLLYGIAPWLPFLSAAVMYLLAGVAATRIRVGGNPRNGSDSGNGDSDDDGGKAGGASFFRDFAEGWSWSQDAGVDDGVVRAGEFRGQWLPVCDSAASDAHRRERDAHRIREYGRIPRDAGGCVHRRTDQRYRTGRAGDMLRIRVHLHRFAADAADRQLLGAAYRQRRDVPAVPDHQRVAARVHFR